MTGEQKQTSDVALVPINQATVGFQADKDTKVTTDVVALVKGMCQLLDVPIMGLNILGGRPYINLDGYYWRAKRDGLQRIIVKVHKEATREDPTAKMTATVILGGGLAPDRTFQATAWHSAETEKMGTMKTADLINMKCESKAVRRALRMATGIGSGFTTEEEAAEDEARRHDPTTLGREAQIRFWARATELYPAQPGGTYRVDKAKVHEIFGVGPEDGALRAEIDRYKKETGVDEAQAWDDALSRLEDKAIGIEPETAPIEAEAEAVPPEDANGASKTTEERVREAQAEQKEMPV